MKQCIFCTKRKISNLTLSDTAMPFQLTILGTSSALPTSNRYPTAQVLEVSGRFFLIDCGEGTQTQMRKYKIGFSKINHIFISHLHGDHIFGLIGLISTMDLFGRVNDLHIYSYSELQKFISHQLNFLYPNEISFKIIYHPLNFKKEQKIFVDSKVTVYSFPLSHRVPTCGFRFEEKPALPNLLEWVQDGNWPVAGVFLPFLASVGAPLAAHVRHVFQTDDEQWKYFVLCNIVGESRELALALVVDLERLAESPTKGELNEGLNVLANELLEKLRNDAEA